MKENAGALTPHHKGFTPTFRDPAIGIDGRRIKQDPLESYYRNYPSVAKQVRLFPVGRKGN